MVARDVDRAVLDRVGAVAADVERPVVGLPDVAVDAVLDAVHARAARLVLSGQRDLDDALVLAVRAVRGRRVELVRARRRRGVVGEDVHLDGLRGLLAVRVGDGEGHLVGAVLLVGVGRVRFGARRRAVPEVPLVGDAARRTDRELVLTGADGLVLRVRARRVGAVVAGHTPKAVIARDREEAAAVRLHVQRPVGTELGVHVVPERRDDRLHVVGPDGQAALTQLVLVEEQGVADVAVVVVDHDRPVLPVLGPAAVALGGVLVVAVDRARHDRLAAAAGDVRAALDDLPGVVGRDPARGAREVRAATAGPVPEVHRGHRRELGQAGVVGRVVARVVAVVPAARAVRARHVPLGRVVAQRVVRQAVAVGLLVAHAVRPAVVARLRDRGELLVLRRALGRVGATRVGADPGRVRHVGLRVDVQARGVAQAHRVDLRARLVAVALVAREQVRAVGRVLTRDRVGRSRPDRRLRPVGDVVDRVDAQHLPVQVVGVAGRAARVAVGDVVVAAVAGGRLARVAGRAPDALPVARVVALRGVVVTGGDVEVPLGVEAHAAAAVAAGVDLALPVEDDHLGVEVDLLGLEVHREPRDPRPLHLRDAALGTVRQALRLRVRVERRVVVEVDVPGLQEVRGDRDTQEARLDLVRGARLRAAALVAVDLEDRGGRDPVVLLLLGVPDVHGAAALADVRVRVVVDVVAVAAVRAADVDDPAVRRDREAVRLARLVEGGGRAVVLGQLGGRVERVDRGLAVAAHEAGGPLDGPAEVVLHGLVVAVHGAAETRVDGAAALEVAAPGERPVDVRVRAVAGDLAGAHADERVDAAGRVRLPGVEGVVALGRQREVAGGGMDAVAGDHRVVAVHGGARPRADQAVEEGDAGLSLGRGADPDEAVARLDEGLEG